MKLQTTLLGKTYGFRDIKEILAKANEEKTGDKLAGLAAESAQERVAAKVVLSALTLADLRGDSLTVKAGGRADVKITVTLSDSNKEYLDASSKTACMWRASSP